MKIEENKIIFNKKDHKGAPLIATTTVTLNFSDQDMKVVFSLN